jgi:hypothetical protein
LRRGWSSLVEATQTARQLGVGRHRVFARRQIVERVVGRQTNAGALRTDGSRGRLGGLDDEAIALLVAAAVSVIAPIGVRGQELLEQIAVRAVQLDAVEAGLDGCSSSAP